MLKRACATCGYLVRTTQQWLDLGLPSCADGDPLEPATCRVTATNALVQLRARYRNLLENPDRVIVLVAQEQLERLDRGRRRERRRNTSLPAKAAASSDPTRWAYGLAQLLAESGNLPLREREDGSFDR
jgi:hypothetical protein